MAVNEDVQGAGDDDASPAFAGPQDSGAEIADAIQNGTVNFAQQFKALYSQWWGADEAERDYWRQQYPRARQVFTTSHDGIQRSWYSDDFPAGATLTCDRLLFAEIWVDTLDYAPSERARCCPRSRRCTTGSTSTSRGDDRSRRRSGPCACAGCSAFTAD